MLLAEGKGTLSFADVILTIRSKVQNLDTSHTSFQSAHACVSPCPREVGGGQLGTAPLSQHQVGALTTLHCPVCSCSRQGRVLSKAGGRAETWPWGAHLSRRAGDSVLLLRARGHLPMSRTLRHMLCTIFAKYRATFSFHSRVKAPCFVSWALAIQRNGQQAKETTSSLRFPLAAASCAGHQPPTAVGTSTEWVPGTAWGPDPTAVTSVNQCRSSSMWMPQPSVKGKLKKYSAYVWYSAAFTCLCCILTYCKYRNRISDCCSSLCSSCGIAVTDNSSSQMRLRWIFSVIPAGAIHLVIAQVSIIYMCM